MITITLINATTMTDEYASNGARIYESEGHWFPKDGLENNAPVISHSGNETKFVFLLLLEPNCQTKEL